jgi:hypothetical protein
MATITKNRNFITFISILRIWVYCCHPGYQLIIIHLFFYKLLQITNFSYINTSFHLHLIQWEMCVYVITLCPSSSSVIINCFLTKLNQTWLGWSFGVPFQNCVWQPCPSFKIANCPLLHYYKSNWARILNAATWQWIVYFLHIFHFCSMKFFFQLTYTNYAN